MTSTTCPHNCQRCNVCIESTACVHNCTVCEARQARVGNKALFIDKLAVLLNLQDAATARSIDAAACGTQADYRKKEQAQEKLEAAIKDFVNTFGGK